MASAGRDDNEKRKENSDSGISEDNPNKSPHKGSDEDEDGPSGMLRRYLAEKLGFSDGDSGRKPKVLNETSIDGIIKYIEEGHCKNLITMAGAGISTSAGIPDFRSPGSGLYHNLEKYKLPDPQAIFEIGFFRENPEPFFTLAKQLYPSSFKPTVCHYFIRLLNEKGLLCRHYTQNIDTLERVAGLPGEKIVEAHGTFHTSHCLKCKQEYPLNWMKERIFADNVPTCDKCNGVVKPDIVFFGENLPSRFFSCVDKDFSKCDLLIILGSSLAVQPFASLIDRVPKTCPRLLVNREKAGQRDLLMTLLGMGSGMNFDSDDNTRDVAWLGDCDDGCELLADKLGWGDELRKLVKKEHARIDEERKEEATKTEEGAKESKEKKTEAKSQ